MDDPRKDCPFCGCEGEHLDHDEIYINHECCGLVEWNAWNERPIEDALRARLAAAEARVAELEGLLEWAVVQATPLDQLMPGWVGVPAVEWEAIMAKWVLLTRKEVQGE